MSTSAPPVFIVILHLNDRAQTEQCLRSIAELIYPNVSLLLIENGVDDFSSEEISQIVPRAHHLRTEVNVGFTAGVNLGIQRALELGAAYVLLLNSDTKVDPRAVTELVRVAEEDSRIGVVGAKVLQLDQPDRVESAGLRVNLIWGRVYQMGFGTRYRGVQEPVADVLAVSGAAMLLSRAVCEQVGGFDDRYFFYFEDIDFCVRARLCLFRVVAAPHALVYHKGKGAHEGQTTPFCMYYATRNHLMIMARYGRGKGLLHVIRLGAVVALNVLYAIRQTGGSRRERLKAVWKGVLDYRRGVVGRG